MAAYKDRTKGMQIIKGMAAVLQWILSRCRRMKNE